jgi:SagB-type dehydrogenase family enzyme
MDEGSFFLKFIDGELILWNYKTHRQFKVSLVHVQRLMNYYERTGVGINYADAIDTSLASMGVLPEDNVPHSEWGWDVLSHIFHLGTQDLRYNYETGSREAFVSAYTDYCDTLNIQTNNVECGNTYENCGVPFDGLPAPTSLTMTLGDVLLARKTVRSFIDSPIDLLTFATICHFAFRYIHPPDERFSRHPYRKTSPSGGNIHCEDLFVWVRSIAGVAPGIYRYLPHSHAIQRMDASLTSDDLTRLLLGQYFAEQAAFGVFIVADFAKSWFKYKHSRGYRAVLMDLGHLSQTFHLCCAALNVGSWITGAFEDTNVRRLLGLDGTFKYPILFLAAGLSDGTAIPEAFYD